MNKIKIGWSAVSIVPEGRRISLAGQFYERISGEVETPIYVTALALDTGDDHVIFVGCDLVCTSTRLLSDVRALIPEDCGFDKSKLIISAIHTHTSMGYAQRDDDFDCLLSTIDDLKPEGINYVPLVTDESPDILKGEEARAFLAERIAR